ncbi:MAG: RNA-binding transcriptional accessory protein [Cytophagales bacterium]|nr:MAG: RNA-binding transcriptional accessory protein [Cytophagales bacterium]TAF60197.1 MAG: RNA-binding transcriptional accessory protein [Cytophagales bacterium]
MENNYIKIAAELSVSVKQVKATIELLDEGNTVPFIARYRKELTDSLDEVQIADIRDRAEQLRELDKRKEAIIKSIEEQGKLTPDLLKAIAMCETMAVLEDIYLPYKPKRKTRASMAREKGLEPLALWLLEQTNSALESEANQYVSAEKEVASIDEALAGARDIIAEMVNENAEVRSKMRVLFEKKAIVYTKVIKGKEEEGQKYKDYFDWSEPLQNAPSHRILAMRRAEKESIITLDCEPEEESALNLINEQFLQNNSPSAQQVEAAIKDSYKRLLKPSMETEVRLSSKKRADEEAIKVFADNMRQLLLAAPLGSKRVLALDPGFRTGCKLVCINEQGALVFDSVIYPNEPQKKVAESGLLLKNLCREYKIEAVAIGNGTASRETERFVRNLDLPKSIQIVVVNESGASIYSASKIARDEFPDKDVTVRGAVSIGRRLIDPLAELVKIEPKSVGVGQYQHDVDQKALKTSLDDVVISCVNAVGVDVNTASKELLSYVSGLGESLAKNIVEYRTNHGAFGARSELKKVPRLGEKAFEQAAGFLRIPNANNPLDASAVHPESYDIVERMAKDLGCGLADLLGKKELVKNIQIESYVDNFTGLPTLRDILTELAKPGRDPRQQFEDFKFTDGVEHMDDLREGMKLPGIVTNITDFGAFVDIGVHQDGLVHLSQIADNFVAHPSEVLKVQQKVEVTVVGIDVMRRRISLSMKSAPVLESSKSKESAKEGEKGSRQGSTNRKFTRDNRDNNKPAFSTTKNNPTSKNNPTNKGAEPNVSKKSDSELMQQKLAELQNMFGSKKNKK